ncbi:MAG TPA: hypothetical protein VFN32_05105, partial [Rhodococcus sp. (in: high G+C Gram-positive bacteria)]|nr:hypothetical protein [Rhodococcus sp. (in: high G+C Gram-positive bacteria)]
MSDTTNADPAAGAEAEKPRVGRPRKYDSPADRVRAHRERARRRKEAEQLAELTDPATPIDAAANLTAAVTALRALTAASIEQHTAVATQISAALDKLTDPGALDAQLHRTATELAKVKADADAVIARLKERLAQATDDRDNADAAVEAVDRELSDARAAHSEKFRILESEHHDELARVNEEHADALRRHGDEHAAAVAEHEQTVNDLHATIATQREHLDAAAGERERLGTELGETRDRLARADTAVERARADTERHAATIGRLESDLGTERSRVAELRDALEDARVTS